MEAAEFTLQIDPTTLVLLVVYLTRTATENARIRDIVRTETSPSVELIHGLQKLQEQAAKNITNN